jgi:hypothetical protein
MPTDTEICYLKRIANPVCTLSRTQKSMIGSFRQNVNRQNQSRQARLRILAEKRSRINSPPPSVVDEESDASDVSKHSEQPTESEELSEPDTIKTPEPPFRMYTPPPIQRTLPTEDTSEDSDMGRKIYEDELDSRMEDLGIGKQQDESIRTQELRYWRKKVSLEEEAAVKQAGMLLSLLSSFVESFTNAIGFTTIRTQGLSEAIQSALESGDFDLAIKSYCVSPQALSMLKNPVTSFFTSFGHVILRTHIENVKREIEEGIEKFKHKQQVYHPPVDTRNVTDSAGHIRPAFKLNTEPMPSIGETFRSQVSSMGPVLTAMKHVATAVSDTKEVDESYRPSGLSLA